MLPEVAQSGFRYTRQSTVDSRMLSDRVAKYSGPVRNGREKKTRTIRMKSSSIERLNAVSLRTVLFAPDRFTMCTRIRKCTHTHIRPKCINVYINVQSVIFVLQLICEYARI